ncbi:MAG: hypothetical protein Q7J98_10150 [Kiritimatiellia bacterium]|nr:hypothetical protein [Kiritimatiellia bacterium]
MVLLATLLLTPVSPGLSQNSSPASSAGIKSQAFPIQKGGVLSPQQPVAFGVTVQGKSDGPMYADPPGTFLPWRQKFYNSVSISIENKGREVVKSPWIVKTGEVNLFSIDAIVEGILKPGMSDGEKARGIYEFDQAHRFHDYPQNGGEHVDPVKYYNVYGYGICGDDAVVLTTLYQKAGLKPRAGWPMGHSTVEVFYNNAWHLLDSDLSTIALKEDNTTIASEEDFARDPFLLARTHTYGFKYGPWDPNRDAFAAALQWYLGPRIRIHPGLTGHTMAFDLRPGEKITWLWEERRKPVGNIVLNPKHDFAGKHFQGCWEYELRKEALDQFRSGDRLIVPFKLPYPIVGATVEAPDGQAVSVSADGKKFSEAGAADWRKGIVDDDLLKLLGLTRSVAPPYAIWFSLPADAASALPIRFKLDFQAAPKSLPQLTLAENRFAYTDASDQRNVEVVVQWRENNENSPPAAPSAPVWPIDKARVKGSELTFEWSPSTDPDGDAIADYQFVLSEFPDCRYARSSNFNVLLSETTHKGTTKFKVPYAGLLNPSLKYYWRVRARDAKDCWSPWGPVWSFEIDAPGIPRPAAPEIDAKSRCVKLRWTPGAVGSPSTKYRVYGSNYRGFTPSRDAVKMLSESGKDGRKFTNLPPNLLMDVIQPECSIPFDDAQKMCAFYRIQAVNAEGTEGCFSPQIEVPGPILLSPTTIKLQPGQVRVPLTIFSSAGRLANIDGNAYILGIAFQDVWRVEVVTPAGLEDVNREPGCLLLAKPIETGKEIKARVRVMGCAYYNRERQKELDLTLVGGGPGDWKAKAPQPPSKGRVLLKMDLAGQDLAQDPKIKVEEAGFVLKKVAGQPALSLMRPNEEGRAYARVSCPLELTEAEKASKDGVKGRIVIRFSLFWDTHTRVDRHEVQLLQKDGQWTYLALLPWNAITITQKVKDQGTVSRRSPVSFNYPYGELVPFRWEIDPNGVHRVFQGDRLLFEAKDLPGRDGFLLFRAAAMIGQPNPGSMGFGPVTIEQYNE